MRKVCTRILNIIGDVVSVKADGIGYNELAVVMTSRGKSLAQVIRLDGDIVYLQAFSGSKGVSTGDEVRFLGHPMNVGFSDNMLSQVARRGRTPFRRGHLEALYSQQAEHEDCRTSEQARAHQGTGGGVGD